MVCATEMKRIERFLYHIRGVDNKSACTRSVGSINLDEIYRIFPIPRNGDTNDTQLRLCRGRRGIGRLRPRQPAVRRRPPYGVPAGSRPRRPLHVDPRADRVRQDDVPPRVQLGLPHRSRSEHAQPPPVLAARPHARRLQLDQRADLRARAAAGLRPLGRTRQSRLELARVPAVFPQARTQHARRRAHARHRRPAVGVRDPAAARTRRCVRGRVEPSGRAHGRRFQHGRPGRRRLLPAHHAQRAALFDGGGVPEARARAAEPACRNRCAGAEGAVRRRAGVRRAVRPAWQGARGARAARGDSRGRRAAVAATAAGVGRRAGRAPEPARDSGRRRSRRCRREPRITCRFV